MKIKKYSAYLYDLDGTLLDSFPDLIEAIKLSIDPLKIIDEKAIKDKVSSGGKAMIEAALNNRESELGFEKILQKFQQIYYANSMKKSQLFDGINSLIDYHQRNNQKWAIITNKMDEPAKKISKFFNLNADLIVGRGFLKNSKPEPDGLIYAYKKFGLEPQDCLFIGDHQNDILAAKNAKMPSALVSWGYIGDLNELLKLKPDYLINHPSELMV